MRRERKEERGGGEQGVDIITGIGGVVSEESLWGRKMFYS